LPTHHAISGRPPCISVPSASFRSTALMAPPSEGLAGLIRDLTPSRQTR
jgi:hypothetical protein